ncbi:MAG: universal stress protein [Eggerthellaceae bacterium]|nr:universal stress protein [Eggerthellaceae bacterium]
MYQSILVPYDNSAQAKDALRNAIMIAETCDAKVTVVSVVDSFDFNDPNFVSAARAAGVVEFDDATAQETKRQFSSTQEEVLVEQTADIVGDYANVAYYAVTGKPQQAIIDYGESGNYDLIVMGCRGLGGFRGAVGSISRAIIHSVSIPVLLVK